MGRTEEARELSEIKETSKKTWMVLCELTGKEGLVTGEMNGKIERLERRRKVEDPSIGGTDKE